MRQPFCMLWPLRSRSRRGTLSCWRHCATPWRRSRCKTMWTATFVWAPNLCCNRPIVCNRLRAAAPEDGTNAPALSHRVRAEAGPDTRAAISSNPFPNLTTEDTHYGRGWWAWLTLIPPSSVPRRLAGQGTQKTTARAASGSSRPSSIMTRSSLTPLPQAP